MTLLAGGVPKILECNDSNDFKVNPNDLDKIITR